ncbi:hypothetical protein FZ103_12770 [Streptomonospora sp. PA3]|uniref:hypothetical protein n=1 Tax=Streptomonospora sp. PA3 TaxID=2607326 RepID=UPI00130BBEDA|nr:hypothetical protein [Streptomonospora sp. PA3]MUL42038.1 hypothetical protein [Streptomonospora sp. PA3]
MNYATIALTWPDSRCNSEFPGILVAPARPGHRTYANPEQTTGKTLDWRRVRSVLPPMATGPETSVLARFIPEKLTALQLLFSTFPVQESHNPH